MTGSVERVVRPHIHSERPESWTSQRRRSTGCSRRSGRRTWLGMVCSVHDDGVGDYLQVKVAPQDFQLLRAAAPRSHANRWLPVLLLPTSLCFFTHTLIQSPWTLRQLLRQLYRRRLLPQNMLPPRRRLSQTCPHRQLRMTMTKNSVPPCCPRRS